MRDLLKAFANLEEAQPQNRPFAVGHCFDAIIKAGSADLKPDIELRRPNSTLQLLSEYIDKPSDSVLQKFLRYLEFYCKDFSLDSFRCLQHYNEVNAS